MFAKPYKLKSNNTLKNSEKKHLAQRIQNEFPSATEEKIKELVPVKSNTICMKLVVSSGETVGVYVVDGVPVMLDTEGGLVPTVCALWKLPDLVPTLTIHSPVLPKILGGAPLYLPGVVIPEGGVLFPTIAAGAVIACNTQDNAAAAVVGRALMSSGVMLFKNAGVCLETIHVFGDLLCKDIKFAKLERPRRLPPSYGPPDAADADTLAHHVTQLTIEQPQPPQREEWPVLGGPLTKPPAPPAPPAAPAAPAPNAPRIIAELPLGDQLEADVDLDTTIEGEPEIDIPSDMDGLLRWCLLAFIKLKGKHIELPLKTNLLYRNHMVPLCPPGRSLDVKKSTYKKMAKFLDAMQQEGILEVRELEKGVDAVVALNTAHPAVRAHTVPADARERIAPKEEEREYEPPVVREMLCVTAHVMELFPDVKKGTALSASEVRNALMEYVRTRNLTAAGQKGAVLLDATLAKILGKQEQEAIKYDALMSGVSGRMTAATELQWPDGSSKLVKSKLEPISMQVVTRSGNKKVTLVSNLEAYGFSLQQLSAPWQRGAGAACGVTRSPGAKADQLMIQGDQTHFVAKLLIEKYGLPKKFLDGADKALNKKK